MIIFGLIIEWVDGPVGIDGMLILDSLFWFIGLDWKVWTADPNENDAEGVCWDVFDEARKEKVSVALFENIVAVNKCIYQEDMALLVVRVFKLRKLM